MKASVYRDKSGMSYTRREYIDGVPGSKVVRFTMGNTGEEFTHRVKLVNLKYGQIRHQALEAARIAALRQLERRLSRENFKLKIVAYPHQVLREHKRINVAQADRFQEGMKKAYGKPVAVAARVDRREVIMFAEVNRDGLTVARDALKRAKHKLPTPTRIMVEKNN